uniref:Fibrinogen C-terminal domain-containing protein n=1 Tax=Macrostomum lignano TaxID=282301 RepID=A0A1I8F297_9PLAT
MHQLTTGQPGSRTLRIELTLWNATVGPEADKYRIDWTGYSGNLDDSMYIHRSKPFSTRGRQQLRLR